jgi:hypothetical protein
VPLIEDGRLREPERLEERAEAEDREQQAAHTRQPP